MSSLLKWGEKANLFHRRPVFGRRGQNRSKLPKEQKKGNLCHSGGGKCVAQLRAPVPQIVDYAGS
eukprot:6127821-Prymnesium_polylepis.1